MKVSNLDKTSVVKVRISRWSYRKSEAVVGFHFSTVIRIRKVQRRRQEFLLGGGQIMLGSGAEPQKTFF